MPTTSSKSTTPRGKPPAADKKLVALCDRLDRVDLEYEAFTAASGDLHGSDLPAAVERKQGRYSARVTRLQRQIAATPASTCVGMAAKARAIRRAFMETAEGNLLDDQDGLLASLTADLLGGARHV